MRRLDGMTRNARMRLAVREGVPRSVCPPEKMAESYLEQGLGVIGSMLNQTSHGTQGCSDHAGPGVRLRLDGMD